MKKPLITLFASLLLIVSCKKDPARTKQIEEKPKVIVEKTFAQKIEVAHKKDAFLAKEAIQFDAFIEFGGNEVFNANVTVSTTSDIAKITYKNGDEIYVNKENIFVSPSLEANPGVRFNAYTWSYFFLFPYKLSDNGTIWNNEFKTQEATQNYDTAKLSFEANIGDAPEDWYVVYKDKKTDLLEDVAYIVTVNKSTEAAEADPHAIKYIDYTDVDGVPFAANWEFYGWAIDKGLTDKIGYAKITNIKFVEGFRKDFAIPENYIKK